MDKSTIHNLIDKVIGKKGLLRIPSWWMRKVLMQIADWVQEGDDANGKKIEKVKEEADGKISTLETNVSTLETNVSTLETNTNSKISTLETNTNNILFELIETAKLPMSIKCFVVKTESQSGYVIVDGVRQNIPINSKRVITFVTAFNFGRRGSSNRISFIGLSATDTSEVTTMAYMFSGCSGLTSLDVTGFDTSAVTSMAEMFSGCRGLTSLDLSRFNTSAVTSLYWMFNNCSSLTSLDLTGFDTSAVTTMDYMFYECRGLTFLDLSSFDTSALKSSYGMQKMFDACTGLISLILGPNFFKTSQVTSVGFSSSTKWTNDTVVTSLVTNSYDRAAAGLSAMTLWLSANTKAALTDEQKATITAKGYTIA